MKKKVFSLVCTFVIVTNLCADNYHPITRSQLPSKAQTFLSTYFPEAKEALLRKEIDVTEISYDVIFTDGCKVEFDRKGNWTEVDCINHSLPTGIVPTAIKQIIRTKYPEANAIKIEMDRREIEVKLSNQVELTFNKKMQLIDID